MVMHLVIVSSAVKTILPAIRVAGRIGRSDNIRNLTEFGYSTGEWQLDGDTEQAEQPDENIVNHGDGDGSHNGTGESLDRHPGDEPVADHQHNGGDDKED